MYALPSGGRGTNSKLPNRCSVFSTVVSAVRLVLVRCGVVRGVVGCGEGAVGEIAVREVAWNVVLLCRKIFMQQSRLSAQRNATVLCLCA